MSIGYIRGLGGKGSGRKYVFENVKSEVDVAYTSRSPIPIGTRGGTSQVINNKVYYIGGYGGYDTSQSYYLNQCYDIETDTWENKENSQTGILDVDSVLKGTKIYIIGGDNYTFASGINRCYDALTDTWSTLANMTTSRDYAATSIVDNDIYVICGSTVNSGNSRWTNINESYNILTDTWSTKASAPESARYSHASSIGSEIFLVTARKLNDSQSQSFFCYNALTDTWSSKTKLPTYRTSFACCTLEGKFYIFGGNFSGTETSVICFDPQTNIWDELPNFPGGGSSLTVCVSGFCFYIIGGQRISSIINDNICMDLYGNSLTHFLYGKNKLLFDKEITVGDTIIPANTETTIMADKKTRVLFRHKTSGIIETMDDVVITNKNREQ